MLKEKNICMNLDFIEILPVLGLTAYEFCSRSLCDPTHANLYQEQKYIEKDNFKNSKNALMLNISDFDLSRFINMPAVPPGAFAACKVKEREMKIAIMQATEQDQEKMFYHGKYLELSPLKYNSKLMNSIWGLYNRYSVHNFKKITDAGDVVNFAGSQQMNGFPAAADKTSAVNKGQKSSSSVLVSDWINILGTHRH